jgi:hypothetical protein
MVPNLSLQASASMLPEGILDDYASASEFAPASSIYSSWSSRSSWSPNLSIEHEPLGPIAAQPLKRSYPVIDPVKAGVFDESKVDDATITLQQQFTNNRRRKAVDGATNTNTFFPHTLIPSSTKTALRYGIIVSLLFIKFCSPQLSPRY